MKNFLSRFIAKTKRKKKEIQEHKKYVEYVCKETGWSYKKAKAAMDAAKKDGISYKYYVKRKIWSRSEAELEQTKRNMKIVAQRNKEDHAHAIEEVCKATGWSEKEAREHILDAGKNCGCSFKDYYKFRLYQYTPEKQREFLTLKVCEKLEFKYNRDPEMIKTLLYKGRFAKKYSDLLGRKWFINKSVTYDEFLEKTEGVEDLILKPVSSTQGKGVEKIHCGGGADDKREIFDRIKAIDRRMICEECIVQHPDIAAFNPSSVNTIRVLTIMDKGQCYHVYAGFRMGRGDIVDNFHAGGIISTVDVETGITCMDAIDLDGRHYPVHPVSGLATKGFQIPHWDKVLAVTEEAARRLEGVGMVGWDVDVTQDGVCLTEGNSEASSQSIQLPYVEDGIGMKKIFDRFLDE